MTKLQQLIAAARRWLRRQRLESERAGIQADIAEIDEQIAGLGALHDDAQVLRFERRALRIRLSQIDSQLSTLEGRFA